MSKGDQAAFPTLVELQGKDFYDYVPGSFDAVSTAGLTKRELFAAMAMQGLKANSIPGPHHRVDEVVREAVEVADALIAELKRTGDQA